MFLQRKTLYNLIQLNLQTRLSEDKLESWQKENFREFSTEGLFSDLCALKLPFDQTELEQYGQNYDTPEELAESVTKELTPLDKDHAYLLLFELWRRLFPEKRSLSLFCDELDYQIMLYDLEENPSLTDIQDDLAYLQIVLDEHVDEGAKPLAAFGLIQTYCANDLESFLYDYILDLIDASNHAYAAELLEGFDRYITDKGWFDYLLARNELLVDPQSGYSSLEKLVIGTKKQNLELNLEILSFLSGSGTHSLFTTVAKKTLSRLESEEDLQEFCSICAAHYHYLGLECLTQKVDALLQARPEQALATPLTAKDPSLVELKQILAQKVQFATEPVED